jgi:Selenocysteine synthase N terminal
MSLLYGSLLPPLPRETRCIPMPRGIVRDVDTRRHVPRTDLLLADPRLAEAERRLGRALVKAAVARAQQRAWCAG